MAFGQKSKIKLPPNLDKEKVIFLQYEEIPIDDSYDKSIKRMYENLNKVFVKTNPKLVQEAKKYQFDYTISKRAEYETLVDQGYKYVLESEYTELLNNGSYFPNTSAPVDFYVYFKDIETNKKYNLFKISTNDLFDHKEVMSKLSKLVKKEYYIQ